MEVLRRHSHGDGLEDLRQLLVAWETWAAAVLESHLSYPVLAHFRSQHDNESWLSALTAVLDTSSLVITGLEGPCKRQAEMTFAMARHTAVDLSIVFNIPPWEPKREDRLPPDDLTSLRKTLAENGLILRADAETDQQLINLRDMYEPYLYALANFLCFDIPPWMPDPAHAGNWQTSAWKSIAILDEKAGQGGHRHRHF